MKYLYFIALITFFVSCFSDNSIGKIKDNVDIENNNLAPSLKKREIFISELNFVDYLSQFKVISPPYKLKMAWNVNYDSIVMEGGQIDIRSNQKKEYEFLSSKMIKKWIINALSSKIKSPLIEWCLSNLDEFDETNPLSQYYTLTPLGRYDTLNFNILFIEAYTRFDQGGDCIGEIWGLTYQQESLIDIKKINTYEFDNSLTMFSNLKEEYHHKILEGKDLQLLFSSKNILKTKITTWKTFEYSGVSESYPKDTLFCSKEKLSMVVNTMKLLE
jgi:hypothetical protein